jgi:DNA polymerase III epsilon subunit-like protein
MYSDNIIFFDTEFTTLDPIKGELMSIGLVALGSGKELYIELDYDKSTVEPWVKKHVVPYLNKKKTKKTVALARIEKFIEKNKQKEYKKPYLMAYVNQFDAIYWYKLFGSAKEHPVYWIPLDFASILFAHGYSPSSMGKESFFTEMQIRKGDYTEHNALEDALMLRDVYIKFIDGLSKDSD